MEVLAYDMAKKIKNDYLISINKNQVMYILDKFLENSKKYKKIGDKKHLIGATILYISRKRNQSIPIHMVCNSLDIDRRKIMKSYKKIIISLKLDRMYVETYEYIDFICRLMNLDDKIKKGARKISDRYSHTNSYIMAACSIYISCKNNGLKIGKEEFCKKTKITNGGMQSCLRRMRKMKEK